jgi:hypothetical protein
LKTLLALAVVVAITGPLVLQATQPGTPIRIRVYNYAALDPGILLAAQKRTAAVLNAAGIAAQWAGCPVLPAATGKVQGCAMPVGGTDIVLNLLWDATARQAQTAETFGFAVPTTPTGLGNAYVFIRRAERLALEGPFSVGYEHARATVLGHVIAHEIGHLLLGPGKHSLAGLMSARWSENEIKQLAKGYLPFAREEASLIRSRLERVHAPDAVERARGGQANE